MLYFTKKKKLAKENCIKEQSILQKSKRFICKLGLRKQMDIIQWQQ